MAKRSERPLGTHTIEMLQRLYNNGRGDPRVLRALRDELQHRKPSKTETLRQLVQRHFSAPHTEAAAGSPRATPAVFACLGCSTRLRLPVANKAGVARCPLCSNEYLVEWQGPTCVVTPRRGGYAQPPSPTTSDITTAQQARSVLGVSDSAAWPEVKAAARSLMQQLHPDRNTGAAPAVQKVAEAEFKRVQRAYALLEAKLRPS